MRRCEVSSDASPRRRAPGFSLIELLVVVVVVAGLLAILLPAVGGVRDAARTTRCLSNARQVGVMLNAYLVDSEGVLPVLHNRGSVDDPLPALDTVLLPPSGDTRVYECPADDRDLYETTGTSYLWNFTVSGQRVDDLFSIVGGDREDRIPLVSDKEGFHPELEDKIVVLYADGHASRSLEFALTGGDS